MIKTPEEILNEMHLVIEEGKTVEAHTHLVAEAMRMYAAQFNNELYCLHTGSWDDHHLTAVFNDEDLAKKYIDKFEIKDNPSIDKFVLNPCSDMLNSDLKPYLVVSGKTKKCRIEKGKYSRLYDQFEEGSLHFHGGLMYYRVYAVNDEAALLKGEMMKATKMDEDWYPEKSK